MEEFARWVREAVIGKDTRSLLAYRSGAPHAERAYPTEEHFLPLPVALGAASDADGVIAIDGGMTYGVLSMDSFARGRRDVQWRAQKSRRAGRRCERSVRRCCCCDLPPAAVLLAAGAAMTIALIGASGYVGSAILREALWRGHHVTAVVRNTAKLSAQPGLTAIAADALDTAGLTSVLAGHMAVISAFSGHSQAQIREYYGRGLRSIIAAVKQARVPRLLVVGGAGSLDVAPGVQLVDTPHFPPQWKQTAEGARDALRLLREEPELDWTMLSPSALLERGVRAGQFRLGTDQLLTGSRRELHLAGGLRGGNARPARASDALTSAIYCGLLRRRACNHGELHTCDRTH